ncbi:MAG: glycoside hydrolase family 38 C-terminal domain-containing protein [Sedimentisphaeraceae bacterium JB056]
MEKKKIFFVLSSHWDREWHQSFQNFRYSLVELFDDILDGFESEKLKGAFQTDGQAVMVEDYLQIRPEKTETIQKMAEQGLLAVGPWYVMPDEFLVSGEALVRNLEMGTKVCNTIGSKPSSAGFVCDIFGHCGQLPQIFDKAGIKCGFIWRGLNVSDQRNLVWKGVDDTELLCYVFGYYGYGDFAFQVRHCNEYDRQLNPDTVRKDIEKYFAKEFEASNTDAVLIFDGCDHQHWDRDIYRIVSEYFEKGWNGCEIVHCSLDEYIDYLVQEKHKITPELYGELRQPGIVPDESSRWLLAGVLSSRIHLKQYNAYCQNILTAVAEPLALTATALLNKEYPESFMQRAWKYLLKNQAHDSICGCSIDRVHRDMIYRFDQCSDIAGRIADESLMSIASAVKPDINDGEIAVVLFNPVASSGCREVEFVADIPVSWPAFKDFGWAQEYPDLEIYNEDTGEKLPHQFISIEPGMTAVRIYKHKIPEKYEVHRVRMAVTAELPSLGYTVLKIAPAKKPSFNRGLSCSSLVTSHNTMENEYLRVEINSNGTLNIFDKRTSQIYNNLMVFEDKADAGDNWDYCKPVNNTTCSSNASFADVELICDGAIKASFLVRVHLKVPQKFCYDTMKRSTDYVNICIENVITLNASSEYLDVKTSFQNTASDHRLRVLFSSGADTDTYLSDSIFDVMERNIKLCDDNSCQREMETETRPQQSWTAVHDGQRGLALFSCGLPEIAVQDKKDRPVALTLLRATKRIVFNGQGKDSQMQGKQTFRYRVSPLAGDVDYCKMYDMADELVKDVRYVCADNKKISLYENSKSLPVCQSMLSIEGNCVVSAFRAFENNWQLRVFNPYQSVSDVKISMNQKFICGSHVDLVDFAGNKIGIADVIGNKVVLKLKKKEIVTIEGSIAG